MAPALDTHGDTEDIIWNLYIYEMSKQIRTSEKIRPLMALVNTKSRYHGGAGTS